MDKTVLKSATNTALRMQSNEALADEVEQLPPIQAVERVAEVKAAIV